MSLCILNYIITQTPFKLNNLSYNHMSSSFSSYKRINHQEVIALLSDQNNYKKLAPYKKAIHTGSDISAVFLHGIEEVLTSKQSQPLQILLSLRFLKELMETHEEEIVIGLLQTRILDQMFQYAAFQPNNKDPDRGKFLFSPEADKDQQKLGNSVLRLSLESFQVWASWYPQMAGEITTYVTKYKQLKAMGVDFPKFIFYNVDQVKQVYSIKSSYLRFQQLGPAQEFEQWDTHLADLRKQLHELGRQNLDKMKFDSENHKFMLQFKAFLQRAQFLAEKCPGHEMKLKSWTNFSNFYLTSLGKYKERLLSRNQLIEFWENYEESLEVMDFSEVKDLMIEEKKLNTSDQMKSARNQGETLQSSQQQILTEGTFELIVKEKDAMIERLEKERSRLLDRLEDLKQEYYELTRKSINEQSSHLLHLSCSGIQLAKKEPEPEDL